MESINNPNEDPFSDAYFSASYIELVLENIHRGLMDPESAKSTAATLQHVTDMHPNFWLITYRGEKRASIPISVRDAVIAKDEVTNTLAFIAIRLDVPELIRIDFNENPLAIRILPIGFTGDHLDHMSGQ